jgi:uncharacterized flavoprotein (TIGR03862 family)
MNSSNMASLSIAIIGGGPAGLMAAEVISQAGLAVHVYDAMPSVGRKFLLAGKGGLNLTHAEPFNDFVSRYSHRQAQIEPLLRQFSAEKLRAWAKDLGIETFVGTSQRVFPQEMKAAPLLRAWLRRLRSQGVQFHTRHRWQGWGEGGLLRFTTADGEKLIRADAVVFALGGGSWAKLGSDGAWLPLFAERGVKIAPLQPSNCGFEAAWSEYFRSRFAAHPVKNLTISFTDVNGQSYQKKGEFMLTEHGVEGSLIYAFSAPLRDTINDTGKAMIYLDLSPDKPLAQLQSQLAQRGSKSLSNQLRKIGIDKVKSSLLRECVTTEDFNDPLKLANKIKVLPLKLLKPRPLDEAISTSGGVSFEALTAQLMLKQYPGIFCAGEMLDWEAPTGGYLLTACFAGGYAAGLGVLDYLHSHSKAA